MLAVQRKIYRLETQLAEHHQRINDNIELKFRDSTGHTDSSFERLENLERITGQLSMNIRTAGLQHPSNLVRAIRRSRDDLRNAVDSHLTSDVTYHLTDLSWLISAKTFIQTVVAALKVFSNNVLSINEEIRYWENVLQFEWGVGLYAVQFSPLRLWRQCIRSGHGHDNDITSRRDTDVPVAKTRVDSTMWSRIHSLTRQCVSPALCSHKVGLFPSLSASKLEIQRRRKKLNMMREFNASAVGLLFEQCLSFEALFQTANGRSTNGDLSRRVRASVGLLGLILRSNGYEVDVLEHASNFAEINSDGSCAPLDSSGIDLRDPQNILQELIYILTDVLPRYEHVTAKGITEAGRPSAAVRYWLPLSLAMISATTSFKVAKHLGPVLAESITDLGVTAFDFWKNWVVDPMRKLVRTIRHDEKSEIALMSKNSLETDRASLERMVVDFVLDRGAQNNNSSTDMIAEKVREGDLTPVLLAYEKDLRSPFMGTVRGDLIRALLIQIQKTKVDVEVAMSGIDSLLKSQELVFGFVGLTPGLLISYSLVRWFLGLLGSRRGFRMGRRQDDLRYALRKIHRILSTSSLTGDGRLSCKDHGLLICDVEILLKKGRTMLKGEDLRSFQEDASDLINVNEAAKQLQIVQRMAWTYSKWT
ncbi:NCA2 family protein [Aspergillus foveolatus]|uniref:NCA2 family protein n=1 Tax=Aspergillus foveolatus TaxID=210207 RepID=UPI003CCDBF3C